MDVPFELARLTAAPAEPNAPERAAALLRAPGLPADAVRLCATVLADSQRVDDVRLAHDAVLARLGEVAGARPLAARLYDRLRMLEGRPQKFGTQRRADGTLWPVDPATTDSERAKWSMPPLAELDREPPRGGPEDPR